MSAFKGELHRLLWISMYRNFIIVCRAFQVKMCKDDPIGPDSFSGDDFDFVDKVEYNKDKAVMNGL